MRHRARELRRQAEALGGGGRRLHGLALTLPEALVSVVQASQRAWQGPAAADLEARIGDGARRLARAAAMAEGSARTLTERGQQALREAAELERRAARDEAAAFAPS
jgi:hypothetical protein